MSTKLLKALKKRVGASWEVIEIADTLEDLQSEVGGYIETVTLADDVVILCDEEGHLKDLPDNCDISGVMFAGTILIVGIDGDGFGSCPEDVIDAFAGTDEFYYEV